MAPEGLVRLAVFAFWVLRRVGCANMVMAFHSILELHGRDALSQYECVFTACAK